MGIARFLPSKFKGCGCDKCLDATTENRFVVRMKDSTGWYTCKVTLTTENMKIFSPQRHESYTVITQEIGDIMRALPFKVDNVVVDFKRN